MSWHPPGPARREPGPEPIESVREQLRERGYLQGPVARWVAGGGPGPRPGWRRAGAAALRTGIAAGPVLALPAAASIALASRPHSASPRDLLLLWLYLSGMLGAALALLELGAEAALSAMARRGMVLIGRAERLAGRVGLLFAAAAVVYLASMARGGRLAGGTAGAGWGSWLLWGAILLVSLAAAHLVGRLTRLGSLLAMAGSARWDRDAEAGEAGVPAGRRSPAAAFWLLAGATAVLLVFLPGRTPGAGPPRLSDPFVASEAPGRVVLIALDGLDRELLAAAADRDDCPALARLSYESARYTLESDEPRIPPLRWTTASTGQRHQVHGVLGFQAGRVPGLGLPLQEAAGEPGAALSIRLLVPPAMAPRRPVSGGVRRAAAVWEVLARHGVPAAAVNWWATWPAAGGSVERVVSERAFTRLASGSAPQRDISPPELQAELAGRFAADLAQARGRAAALGLSGRGRRAQAAVADLYHAGVALRLAGARDLSALLVYLPGLDIAGGAPELLPVLDAAIAPFMETARPDDILLVAGDPGRKEDGEGVLLAWGGRVLPGLRQDRPDLLDIAPTVLALRGFPRALDLPGRPVLGFLEEGDRFAASLPPPIGTFGDRRPAGEPLEPDPLDEEVLDRLRSLGYIQ
ncbi:MAG TPA: alkaline phosphatase family protein [Candidatus Polarisedimenticolia bacterium]|nr:alkaline phosphatase family protein [Candidatus Polarisedimenticolia bacterium]